MGRKKREIKRIEEKSCMQVAFCKRRKGLLKKAKELSILCEADVALVIFSNRGRLHEFSSSNSLTGILQRYESYIETEKEVSAEVQDAEHSRYSRFMTTGELLQTIERKLEETDDDGISMTDLVHLENQLQTALMQARSRKTHMMLESVKGLHEKEQLLREENKLLEDEIAGIKNKRQVNEMAMDFTNLPPLSGQQRVTLNLL